MHSAHMGHNAAFRCFAVGRSEGSCICEAEEIHLASLKLLQEDDGNITLSLTIEQDIKSKMDLKLILTGIEEGSNQATFAGRLCNHYGLKIPMNLNDFQDEKKEITILPLPPTDSPKSLRRCCEDLQLAEGPDPNTVAAAYSFVLHKAYKEFAGLKVRGESATLQPPGSDITIHIPEDIHGIMVAHAHTDFQPFEEFVPEAECFIGPVAEVQYIPRDQDHKYKKFLIQIPHGIDGEDAWANVKVRRVDIHRNALNALVPPEDYEVDGNFVNIWTDTPGQFICSKSGCPRACEGKAQAFLFGNPPSSQRSKYSFRLYVCSPLYNLREFRKELIDKESDALAGRVLLDQADMNWVPEVVDERQFIKVLFTSARWNPRLMSGQEWDENSKTVMQRINVRNLPSMSRCHACRLNPTYIAQFDFRLPEGSSFSPFTGKLEVIPKGEREKTILEFYVDAD